MLIFKMEYKVRNFRFPLKCRDVARNVSTCFKHNKNQQFTQVGRLLIFLLKLS